MKRPVVACLLALLHFALGASAAPPASPYVGQEARDIKSLSPEDVNAYLSGKGMGLAKAAELNGYPGPAHVLELASPLALTPEQRAKTQALFASMESKAIALGRALVKEERKLDRLFATRAISPEVLASSLSEIGSLQAKVRGAHLEAHLAQVQILTPEQTSRYLISEKTQQAHAVSPQAQKMGASRKEMRHGDEPSAVSTWTVDAGVLPALRNGGAVPSGAAIGALA